MSLSVITHHATVYVNFSGKNIPTFNFSAIGPSYVFVHTDKGSVISDYLGKFIFKSRPPPYQTKIIKILEESES